jgi:thioredoxin 1
VQVSAASDRIPRVIPEHAPTWVRAHDAFVLDVRELDEYAAGHVPGAVSIPQADLALHLEEIPRQRTVLVACRSGLRSLASARFLKAIGYGCVANLNRGTLG